ncbi:MAG: site-specific integrase [Phycisphaerales bacterium]|nr:site-specific integrase [Phycisphaerales bacterium]
MADFSLDRQDQYVAWRREELRAAGHIGSNGTIKRELNVLKAALRAYWKRGHLSSVPYIRSVTPPQPRQQFLSLEECRHLLDACVQDHIHLFVMMALHTLQRPTAILGLQCGQVDLTHGLIDFLPPGEIQTNKRKPVVPLTPSLHPLLERAIASSQSGHVIEYKGLPVKSIKTAFKATCRRAGLSGVTLYTLRHTGATWAASRGVPMRQLGGMMGHSEITMTERYAKHTPEFLKEASHTLEQLFGESCWS